MRKPSTDYVLKLLPTSNKGKKLKQVENFQIKNILP